MPRFYKYKILLDEGLPPRTRLPRINSRLDVKHIKEDFGKEGLSDEKVYDLAVETNRLLVVFNVKHYKKLVSKSKKTGIIGVSQNMPTAQIDKKLTAILSKSKPNELYGNYTSLSRKK